MSYLQSKKILLGISGSIAAYKTVYLVRLLVKEGADVQVIMTESAKDFITPLTLSTLSKRPVLSGFVKNETGEWNNHVALGLWADVMIVAPATANTLAKCANGLSNDLLTATYLSARCPVVFVPAMDLDMYQHSSTLANIEKLKRFGNQMIEAEHGELASGLVGVGRMAEPENILAFIEKQFSAIPVLTNKKVLITAGPTQEAIDPVRYISNHSTGKMGYAIARAFAMAGADVTLISGPTALALPEKSIKRINVKSAKEMYEATTQHFDIAEIIIFSAAIADYTPAEVSTRKIKKKEATFELALTKTTDVAATLGQLKQPHQMSVGFALETDNEEENALKKLQDKHFDFVILNSLNDKGAGFAHDTNKISVIDKSGTVRAFDLKNKAEVAQDILQLIVDEIS